MSLAQVYASRFITQKRNQKYTMQEMADFFAIYKIVFSILMLILISKSTTPAIILISISKIDLEVGLSHDLFKEEPLYEPHAHQ